jgi:hypothetical protein
MATSEDNRRSADLKIPALPFRGVAQIYPTSAISSLLNSSKTG